MNHTPSPLAMFGLWTQALPLAMRFKLASDTPGSSPPSHNPEALLGDWERPVWQEDAEHKPIRDARG